ncbi:ABC transporter ATP-binding protein [Micromonospora sp. DT48]|uniref:ABC transporter ATP-binding protein n=1 Tax=unclassified Micromonospora TaxID=2617518 RepID=UPI0012BBB4FE|nr:ABC transporter ATP-binding protein [Micromonospora sp. CP22]MTK01518.1 ABC transporter ATP-binding protein [Micromonospora sp. CP22]
MSSPEREVPLPPPLRSMWRVCRFGLRHEPRLMLAALGIALLAAVPDALFALWLKLLSDGVQTGDRRWIYAALIGLGASAALTWFLSVISARVQRRFRDRVTIELESHVARLQARVSTIAHHERPDYLDRLAVLRDQVFVLDHMYLSVFTTLGWILRLVITLALLASISPVLILLAVFAVPTLAMAGWRPAVEQAAHEQAAAAGRLARHLYVTATTAGPAKEVRVSGVGPRLSRERRAAWDRWYAIVARPRNRSAVWHSFAWIVFGLGYVGAIAYVAEVLRAPAGDVLLVLAAGARLSAYVSATVGEIGFLRGMWIDGARRLSWLEDYVASFDRDAEAPAPDRLVDGIRLENVSFAYPNSDRLALEDVTLTLPAGSVVALVGENGAGKSTLIKLLSKFYSPTSGRILVDGRDLDTISAESWRTRLAGAYQDFYRFELRAGQAIGVGDLPRVEQEPAIVGAVARAGADEVVAALPRGLDTQLGKEWPDGVEVSFGQWQKVALARGFMRDQPLLLVLDEPTAALDAETEHALFERYAAGARSDTGTGRVTVLVSHRFSTARMADVIVVLNGARVAEVGSHEELMAAGGRYAELYAIQAAGYRSG